MNQEPSESFAAEKATLEKAKDMQREFTPLSGTLVTEASAVVVEDRSNAVESVATVETL